MTVLTRASRGLVIVIGRQVNDIKRFALRTFVNNSYRLDLHRTEVAGPNCFFIGPSSAAGVCGIDRPVRLYEPEVVDNVYRPLYEVASSKLARKTHVDMLNKVQINYYAAGLHREGSKAAFGEEGYRV